MNDQENLNASLDKLVEQGMQSYPFALLAIQQFRLEIQKRTQNVLKRKIKELGNAMGRDIKESDIQPYADPDGLSGSEYDGSWGLITLKLWVDPVACYFGISFGLDNEGKVESYVTAIMSPWYKAQMNFLLSKSKEITDDFDNDEENHIVIYDVLYPTEHKLFEKRLIDLFHFQIKSAIIYSPGR